MTIPDCSVYFARCFTTRGMDIGAIKIGSSHYVAHRLDAISTNQPYDCRLIGTCPGNMLEEYAAHLWLRPYRISGEYFHADPEVMDFVERACTSNQFPLPVHDANEYLPSAAEARNFLECHGLTLEDLAATSGSKVASYKTAFNNDTRPTRRMIAAMMVAALRKGHVIRWQADLSRPPLQVAA
jgi:hypothetical protein